jgi:hypothetical protein
MDQTVNLLAPGNPPTQVIGTATITGLPDERYPGDLRLLAPLIEAEGRTFQFIEQPFYGAEPTQQYVEVEPVIATGSLGP